MENKALAYKESFIHKINPCIRILCAVILSFEAALSHSFPFIAGCLVLSIVFICSASITLIEVYDRLKPLLLFLLMIWMILPVTFDGDIVYSVANLTISKQGLEYCAMITIKSIAITMFFMAFVATMTIPVMGHALARLHISSKFVFLILMTYRYIFVIKDEYTKLFRAAKIRGFTPKTNIHSYKTFAYLAGMLFVRASLRAKRVHQAMLCRGFNGKFHTIDKISLDRLSLVFFIIVIMSVTLYQYIVVQINH